MDHNINDLAMEFESIFGITSRRNMPKEFFFGKNSFCAPRQRSYIYGLMDSTGYTEGELQEAIRVYFPIKEFTVDEASQAIDFLKEIKNINNGY